MDARSKVALITGGARRVGREIALTLARAGCDVAVHYHRSAAEAREVGAEIEQLGRRVGLIEGDLAEDATPSRLVDETVRALGRLDVLVNNASVFDRTPPEPDAARAAWARTFRVNVFAPALLARAAADPMRSGGAGRIINLTDILADRPIRGYGAYCASKAALVSLTRTLALELAPEITVNAIAPGIAEFPESYGPEIRERLVSRVPLRRVGSPEEVAALARFLVTDGDYITGQVIPIDGGWSIGLR